MSDLKTSGAVQRWKSRLAPSTYHNYRDTFRAWLQWLKANGGKFSDMLPDDLIEYQKNCQNSDCYEILDLIQAYVSSKDLRISSKKNLYGTLRSFFMHNRTPLPKDGSFRVRSERPPVKGKLDVFKIKQIVDSANVCYRAIFLSMFMGGMDLSSFDYWNKTGYEDLSKQLRADLRVIKVDLPGRKKNRNRRPYRTYLGIDAIDAIKAYLPYRPENGTAIFYNKEGNAVSKNAVRHYWNRHLLKIGLIHHTPNRSTATRYGMNMHELRDVFRSQWEKSSSKASVAEYLMGHVVDPLGYNKAHLDEEWTRRQYENTLPMLQIMSSGKPFGQVGEDEVDEMRRRIIELEAGKDDRIQLLEERVEKLTGMIQLLYEDPELLTRLKGEVLRGDRFDRDKR